MKHNPPRAILEHSAALLFLLLFSQSCETALPAELADLGAKIGNAQQVVVVDAGAAPTLTLYEKSGTWNKTLGPVSAVIGYGGLAAAESKREGDGKTPDGVYTIGTAFGTAARIESRMPYKQTGPEDIWIDDPASPQYNLWVTGPTQAKSFEKLRRTDSLYDLAFVVNYNTSPVVAGKGSAIFVHVWKSAASPTAGCVAIEHANLAELLSRLDPARSPVIAIRRR